MKPKFLLCLALVLSGLVLLAGCHGIGTQRFTALAPTQTLELTNSSRIVLDVVYHPQIARADYNLHENISMLAPSPRHWKLDATLQVERVIKGDFDGQTLQLHWLRGLTPEQYDLLGISPQPCGNLTNGTLLRIGFDSRSDEHLKKLKIMVRQ
jgi:hypothetical protein